MSDPQFAALMELLTDIRRLLAYLCEPVDAQAAAGCEHPEESRTDLSTPRETHWVCADCGHVERRLSATLAPAGPGADAKE